MNHIHLGAIFFGGTSQTTIEGCTFRGNFNLGGWGGALVPEENSFTTISDSWFEDNYVRFLFIILNATLGLLTSFALCC